MYVRLSGPTTGALKEPGRCRLVGGVHRSLGQSTARTGGSRGKGDFVGNNGNATDICPVRNRALLFAPTCTTPASGAPLFTQALTEFHTNSEGINNINKQTKQKTGGFKVSALCALHCDNNATGAKLRVDSSTTPRVRTVASVTVRAAAPPEGSGGGALGQGVLF